MGAALKKVYVRSKADLTQYVEKVTFKLSAYKSTECITEPFESEWVIDIIEMSD
jgi:hypothetical protein